MSCLRPTSEDEVVHAGGTWSPTQPGRYLRYAASQPCTASRDTANRAAVSTTLTPAMTISTA